MSQYKQSFEEIYPNLFSPFTIGNVTFKNRIFTAPAALAHAISPEGFITNEGILEYARKAPGGAAVVTLNEVRFEGETASAHNDTQLNLSDEAAYRTLNLFTEYVHSYNAKASIELIHCGQFTNPGLSNGNAPMGPSARVLPDGTEVKEMTEEDMERVADSFAKAALSAKRAGFDMALIHGGHGWLLTQFVSPLENKRKDKYGGSLENRARFPIMVLDRMREAVGKDFLFEYRFSVTELTPGGLEIDEGCEFVKMIEDKIDIIHCSVGGGFTRNPVLGAITHPSHFMPDGCNAYLAEAVKKSGVKIPVVAIGAINNPDLAEQIISDGKADFVTMVRSFIAEPDWAEKARAGKAEDIRPCIKCLYCLSSAGTGHIQCSVNPSFSREQFISTYPHAERSKKIIVIGGGPAGTQAALKASERGHEVIIYEKSNRLGGQLIYADYVAFKENMKKYREYLVRQVEKAGITVRLNTEATPEMVHSESPDAVIVALGAEPIIPQIPGVERTNVIRAIDAYSNLNKIGNKVVVVGGGMVGCETSLHMAESGKDVVLVEMGKELAPDGSRIERMHTIHHMDKELKYYTGVRCTEITDKGVEAIDESGDSRFFEADTVILACGMKAKAEERDSFNGVAFDVIPVGDCITPGILAKATKTGFYAGLTL